MDKPGSSFYPQRDFILSSNTFYPPRARYQCDFREKCFRNNPQHFEKYSHPITHPYVKANFLHSKSDTHVVLSSTDQSSSHHSSQERKPQRQTRHSPQDSSNSTTVSMSPPVESTANHYTNPTSLHTTANLVLGQYKFDPVLGLHSMTAYTEPPNLLTQGKSNQYRPDEALFTSSTPPRSDAVDVELGRSIPPTSSPVFEDMMTESASSECMSYIYLHSSVDWNEGFQQCVKGIRGLSPNTRQEQRQEIYQQLVNHGLNFISTAKTYGKIIVTEVYMDPRKKTIKPLRGQGCTLGVYLCLHCVQLPVETNTTFMVSTSNLQVGKGVTHYTSSGLDDSSVWIR